MHKYINGNLPQAYMHAQYLHAEMQVLLRTRPHVDYGDLKMVQSVRLNDQEQEALRKKAVELNKILIQKGQQPIRDSELVHILIEQGIEFIEVGASGNVIIPK